MAQLIEMQFFLPGGLKLPHSAGRHVKEQAFPLERKTGTIYSRGLYIEKDQIMYPENAFKDTQPNKNNTTTW